MARSDSAVEARRHAKELFVRAKDEVRVSDRDKARQADATKTAKLRELRLAKEAADRKDRKS